MHRLFDFDYALASAYVYIDNNAPQSVFIIDVYVELERKFKKRWAMEGGEGLGLLFTTVYVLSGGGPQFFKNLRPPPPRGSIQLCYTGPVVFTRIKRDQQLLDTFFNVVYSINFIKKKKNSIIFRRRFFFRFNNYLT